MFVDFLSNVKRNSILKYKIINAGLNHGLYIVYGTGLFIFLTADMPF